MLERLLESTVEVSLASSVLILLLLLLTPLLKRQYTAKWRYWIWMVIALRLAVPFNLPLPQAPVSLPVPEQSFTYPVPVPSSPTPLPPPASGEPLSPAGMAAHSISLVQIASLIWIAGIVVFIVYALIGALVFRRSVLRWAKNIKEGPILILFEEIAGEMKLRKQFRIAYCRKAGSPMMTGFFHPLLLLPEEEYSEESLRFILRHELIHYRRRDIWYKLLMLVANAVHWFNPLVYLMVRAANQDIEISCDEEVLKGVDFDSRRRYGDTIMSVIHSGKGRRTVFSTYFKGGKRSMKQRFAHIFDTKAKKRGAAALCAVLIAACTAGGLIAFREAGAKEGNVSLPFPLGETSISMPDGSVIAVELRMTAGKSIPSDSPDFVSGGGFTEGDNYCGSFELVTRREGEILSSNPLDFGEDSDKLVFHGPVTLMFTDYNGDKSPELTIGSWVWSGGNQYNVYSVGANGALSLLAQSVRHDSQEPSVLFQPLEGGGFAVNRWNQLKENYSQVSYLWDGSRYIEETEELTFPYPMGVESVALAGGGNATLELRMVNGELITSDSPDFVPGGGMDGLIYDRNYVGDYELAVLQDGTELSAYPVVIEGDSRMNLPGPLSFSLYDYNGDGDPEFTLGGRVPGNNLSFNLYSISSAGEISLLAGGLSHMADSVTAAFPAAEKGFILTTYSNDTGGYTRSQYQWDGKAYRLIASNTDEAPEAGPRSITIETKTPSGASGRHTITDKADIDTIAAVLRGAEAVSENTRVIFPAGGSALEFYFSSGEHVSVSAGQISGTDYTILQSNGAEYRLGKNVFSELRRQYGILDNPQSSDDDAEIELPVNEEAEQEAIRQAVGNYYSAFQRNSSFLSSLEVNSVNISFQSATDADVYVNYTVTAAQDSGDFVKGTYPVDDVLQFLKSNGKWNEPSLAERYPHPDGPAYSLLNYLAIVLGEEEYGGAYVTKDNKLAIWATDRAAAQRAVDGYGGIRPPGVEYLATEASIAQLRRTAMEFQASSLQPVKDLTTVNVDVQQNRIRFAVRGKDAVAEWNEFIKRHQFAAYIVIENVEESPNPAV